MVSSRQTITCILVILNAAIYIQAQTQTTSEKVATASISGKVTIKDKAAAGVVVVANEPNEGRNWMRGRYRTKTDQTGSYRIANLPAGTYEISAVTPSLVPQNELNSLVISEGDSIEDVNLSLAPGGVITGKITDAEGQPIIGLSVSVMPSDNQLPMRMGLMMMERLYSPAHRTDDRGIYRAFGLPPGRYRVSVGSSGSGMTNSREYYKQTFYPSVTDAAKATVIEVTEGSETNNVDIVLGRPVRTFTVIGRVVDGETGKPLTNIRYGVGQSFEKPVENGVSSGSSSSIGGELTNTNGEFKLENVTPGRYTVFTVPQEQSDMASASVTFDVVDHDLTDLLITISRGASLSGVVVFEGNSVQDVVRITKLQVIALVQTAEHSYANPPRSGVGRDGTFKVSGVPGGLAHFRISADPTDRKEFEIVRVEHNGVPQPDTISVKEGEQVSGIGLIVKYMNLTGTIRGQIKVADGELPPSSQLWLSVWPLDENLQRKRTSSIGQPQLDDRGRFLLEGLAAGTYEVSVRTLQQGSNKLSDGTTQRVTVADDTVSEVTLILKSKSNPD